MPYPRAFSHIAVAVTDLERAIDFYTGVFGCYHLMGPVELDEQADAETPIGRILTASYGSGWHSLRVARLAMSDSVGIELQQFANAELAQEPPGYRTTGVSHFSVQDPDIEGLAQRIVEHGGSQRTPVQDFYPGEKPFRLVYCQDPFGNIIEIDTHSFETTYSPVSYP
ncbi:MAG: VOC family protein [Solirubrobacterales bacterium]|nr:VOC family protein [Solirubrobacterales bacterium]